MINRLKRSRIELKESQESLVHADKLAALGTLSAGVAHEVNNPISGIKNCINRINKNPDNIEQNSKYIILIKDAINKIEEVMSHLLSYSRKQNIELVKLDINKVIDDAIDLTKHELQINNVLIKFEYSRSNLIEGSSNHLEQVFVNLILNSLDAIVEKREENNIFQAEIKIIVKSQKSKIFVHVLDNGIGISDKSKDKIFDPFYTSKKDGKGTGLGLSVSYNIIEKHKGKIWFISRRNLGTEFIIELPALKKNKKP